MKRTIRDKFQRIEYFLYYIFMVLFCSFLTYYALEIRFTHLIFPVLALSTAVVSTVILISFYQNVYAVEKLLPIYIVLVVIMFVGSAIVESLRFGFHTYVLVMKSSLYFFCILKPIEHLVQLKYKLRQLGEEK